ncbi:MAG: M48 family metalloprotease [Kofleriaceae bacterium]
MDCSRLAGLLIPFTVFTACGGVDDGSDSEGQSCFEDKCDGPNNGTCADPQYGDGVCQTALACAQPDIDCFTIPADDAAAAAWFGVFEQAMADQDQRAPRAFLPQTDPRFLRARQLLDRGWAAFRDARAVGGLYALRPGLVVIDDNVPNAFVAPDLMNGNAGFVVMVQTGLLAATTGDDALVGVMMHELQHAVGLHVVGTVGDELRRYYVAANGNEPIGRFQADDPVVRDHGAAWRALADEAGPHSNAELGGLPTSRDSDMVFVLEHVINQVAAQNLMGCQSSIGTLNQLIFEVLSTADPLSGALSLDPQLVPPRVTQVLDALRTDCLGGYTLDFVETVAEIVGVPAATLRMQIPPEELALVDGKHIVDAIAAVITDRRATQRAVEESFATVTGQPWSALRYFSYEEDADDVSVSVLRGAGLDPNGVSAFMASFLPSGAQQMCNQLLGANTVPPYGVDLNDEHHASCWRAHHIKQYAATIASPRVALPAPSPVETKSPWAIPPRLRDRIAR